MTDPILGPPRPGWRFWSLWMLATFAGAAVGMLFSVPFQLILEAALGPNLPPPWTAGQTALIALLKGAEGGMMGSGIGLGQAWVFRKYLKQTRGWMLATGLAMFLQGAFRWSLPYETPPEQIFLMTALGSGISLGLAQWLVLRGRLPLAGWWVAINLAGTAAQLALHALSNYAGFSIHDVVGMVLLAASLLAPFAVAGAGMVWLLGQAGVSRHSAGSRAPANLPT